MKSFYEIPEIGSSGLTEVVEQQLLEKNLIDKSSYIEEIEICKGVKSVGALMNSRAKKIYLPDGLEQIDEGALCDCEELVELRIPDSLKWVGDYSLYNCSKLEKIELPEGVIELDGYGYGFIGGACAMFDNTLYFCGNIELHPDFEAIRDFCEAHGVALCSLSDGKLYDVGGILFIR
jgi:hypothetical protein